MEKPGIEPATPGLQGIALIHYTTGASQLILVITGIRYLFIVVSDCICSFLYIFVFHLQTCYGILYLTHLSRMEFPTTVN